MTLFAWEFCISIETSHHNLYYEQEYGKKVPSATVVRFQKNVSHPWHVNDALGKIAEKKISLCDIHV